MANMQRVKSNNNFQTKMVRGGSIREELAPHVKEKISRRFRGYKFYVCDKYNNAVGRRIEPESVVYSATENGYYMKDRDNIISYFDSYTHHDIALFFDEKLRYRDYTRVEDLKPISSSEIGRRTAYPGYHDMTGRKDVRIINPNYSTANEDSNMLKNAKRVEESKKSRKPVIENKLPDREEYNFEALGPITEEELGYKKLDEVKNIGPTPTLGPIGDEYGPMSLERGPLKWEAYEK